MKFQVIVGSAIIALPIYYIAYRYSRSASSMDKIVSIVEKKFSSSPQSVLQDLIASMGGATPPDPQATAPPETMSMTYRVNPDGSFTHV